MSRRVSAAPIAAVAAIVVLAAATPLLPLPDPLRMEIAERFARPSLAHLLGQDDVGRDVLARLLWGARASLTVAFAAAAIACAVGTTLGLLGGYLRGVAELLSIRSMDIVLCFPPLLLALLVVTLFGPGAATLVPVLALVYVPGFARIAHSGVLATRPLEYVEAMRVLGAGLPRIMIRTILPNIGGPILVQFSLTIAAAIVLESGLSFLGLGVVPPAPSWGQMIGAARATIAQAPLLLLWPCLALFLTILAMNALCDALRDMVEPRPAAGRARRRMLDALLPGMVPARDTVLELRGLTVEVAASGGCQPVRNISLTVKAGETVAIVGESGSGKSLTGLAVAGLLPPGVLPVAGSVWLEGSEVLRLPERSLRQLRGSAMAMVFQDPSGSLNPVHRVGAQIAEAIRAHRALPERAVQREVLDLLRRVGIPDPERRARDYPHELSGGMRQRVMIAIAVANAPRLLIADEPTTALDVTIQAQVLDVLAALRRQGGLAMLFISHSLPVVAQIADRVVVMYAGEVLEEGPTTEVFARPLHPYTAALLRAAPREHGPPTDGIAGVVPPPDDLPSGCRFAPRCDARVAACESAPPALASPRPGRTTRCIRWSELCPSH